MCHNRRQLISSQTGPPQEHLILEEAAEEERVMAGVPLEERFSSSRWEARSHAVKEVAGKCSDVEFVRGWSARVAGLIGDKNAAVQKDAIECYISCCKSVDSETLLSDWENHIFTQAFETSALTHIRCQKSTANLICTICQFIKDKNVVINRIENMLNKMKEGKNTSVPQLKGTAGKTAAALLQLATALLSRFGLAQIPLTQLLPQIASFIQVTDRSAKEAAYALAVEFYRWTKSLDLVKQGIETKQIIVKSNTQLHV